jgi:hypothetical protein
MTVVKAAIAASRVGAPAQPGAWPTAGPAEPGVTDRLARLALLHKQDALTAE